MSNRKDASPIQGVPVATAGQPGGWSTDGSEGSFSEWLIGRSASSSGDPDDEPKSVGSCSGVLLDDTPPTNRGCLEPLGEVREEEKGKEKSHKNEPQTDSPQAVTFHVDYLKSTVWTEIENLTQIVTEQIEEILGFEAVFVKASFGGLDTWTDERSGVQLFYHASRQTSGATWCQVQLKGESCQRWGDARLRNLLMGINAAGVRWRLSRVDAAWDHGQITPRWFYDQILAGNFVSRCLDQADRDWRENALGQTAYLGLRKDHKERLLRVYNKYGYNRVELEMSGKWAEKMGEMMADTRVGEWPGKFLEVLTGAVDLVDRSKSSRISRAPRLQEWHVFVGDAQRMVTCSVETAMPPMRLEVGKAEGFLQRNWRQIAVMLSAFSTPGDRAYLSDRVLDLMLKRPSDEHDEIVRRGLELRKQVLAGYGRPGSWPSVEIDDAPF